jgi:hypothetical protein
MTDINKNPQESSVEDLFAEIEDLFEENRIQRESKKIEELCDLKAQNTPKARSTVPIKKILNSGEKASGSVLTGCLSSIIFIVIGCIFLMIPFVGWIIGGFLILSGLVAPFAGGTGSFMWDYELSGDCPCCGHFLKIPMRNKWERKLKWSCDTCKETILVKQDVFYSVLKQFSD